MRPMERLSPIPAAEPHIPEVPGSGSTRRTVYALLALLVLAGGWVRFNDRIASVAPGLAAPAAPASEATRNKGLVELGLVPAGEAPAAIQAMNLPASDAAALATAVKEDRVRLVQLPVFDTGDSTPGGRTVEISTAGFSQLVRLTPAPLRVTLPINRAGEVSFRIVPGQAGDPGGMRLASIGALTLSGPVHLPDLHLGDRLSVGVVAQ
jgi:hypothetical protein